MAFADSRYRILIVEDESLVADEIQDTIERLGYAVIGRASTGEEGIDQARELKPDMILMDVVMPRGRLDGIAASRAIKKEMDIPVIFLTAFGGDKVIQKAKDVDPFGFLVKPFQETELRAAIEFGIYRKDMQKRLIESEKKYRSVVNTAIEVIITIDIHMNISFWNKAAEIMFQYTAGEVEGQPFTLIIPERFRKDLQRELDRMVLTEEWNPNVKTTQCVARRKDDSEFPMEFSLASWIVDDEIYFTIIARDITERKKVEQMKTDFVSLVSHQLKTPVAGIMGCVDNMMNGLTGELTEKQIEYLNVMNEISQRSYRIINDLLNVSRIERGVVSVTSNTVDLNDLIKPVLDRFSAEAGAKGLTLNYIKSRKPVDVIVDKDKLFEAMSNVIHNAVKFTEKGSIEVRVRDVGGMGFVEVSDTGPGIDPDIMKALFNRDQIFMGSPSVKGGCGLGLYIAKEFMKLMNGDIMVSSRLGKGSRFTFEIPLAKHNKLKKKKKDA